MTKEICSERKLVQPFPEPRLIARPLQFRVADDEERQPFLSQEVVASRRHRLHIKEVVCRRTGDGLVLVE